MLNPILKIVKSSGPGQCLQGALSQKERHVNTIAKQQGWPTSSENFGEGMKPRKASQGRAQAAFSGTRQAPYRQRTQLS